MSTDERRNRGCAFLKKHKKRLSRSSSVLIGVSSVSSVLIPRFFLALIPRFFLGLIPRFFLALIPLFFLATTAKGQQPEGRIDAIATNPAAIHVGAGLIYTTGTYLRSGIEGGIGASKNGISGRIDIVNRFHLDPFREHKWAPYGGGGITTRLDNDRKARVYLLLIAGVDGPAKKGLSTSIEAGLGGGARLGVIVRKTKAERR